MKKKIVLLMMAMVLIFTGCMQSQYNFEIQSDGKVTFQLKVDYEKDVIDNALKEQGISEEEYKLAMSDMKIVTIDDKEYYEILESGTSTAKELMSSMNEEGVDFYITEDTFYAYEKTSSGIGMNSSYSDTLAVYGIKESDIDTSAIKSEWNVTFSENIVTTNGIVDSENPKKVTFAFSGADSAKSYTMFATTNEKVTLDSVKKLINDSNTIKKPTLKSVKANKVKKKKKNATVTVKFSKVTGAKSYVVEYSTKKNFKNSSTKTVKKTTVKLTKMKKGKKYYFRVFAQKENYAGNTVTSKASKTKSVKTKK